jgi:hypothetical protein
VGRLKRMIWFDVSYNHLNGNLPVSDSTAIGVGLDSLNVSEHLYDQLIDR